MLKTFQNTGVSGGKVSLLLGRMVVGIGVGLASHLVPLYISECSSAEKRGVLITMNNIAITGGQLVAAITCGVFANVTQVVMIIEIKHYKYLIVLPLLSLLPIQAIPNPTITPINSKSVQNH